MPFSSPIPPPRRGEKWDTSPREEEKEKKSPKKENINPQMISDLRHHRDLSHKTATISPQGSPNMVTGATQFFWEEQNIRGDFDALISKIDPKMVGFGSIEDIKTVLFTYLLFKTEKFDTEKLLKVANLLSRIDHVIYFKNHVVESPIQIEQVMNTSGRKKNAHLAKIATQLINPNTPPADKELVIELLLEPQNKKVLYTNDDGDQIPLKMWNTFWRDAHGGIDPHWQGEPLFSNDDKKNLEKIQDQDEKFDYLAGTIYYKLGQEYGDTATTRITNLLTQANAALVLMSVQKIGEEIDKPGSTGGQMHHFIADKGVAIEVTTLTRYDLFNPENEDEIIGPKSASLIAKRVITVAKKDLENPKEKRFPSLTVKDTYSMVLKSPYVAELLLPSF